MEELIFQLSNYTPISVTVRVVLAVLLGSLVGWNRGRQGRAAGMRTHALVCLGSALTILVGLHSTMALGLSGDPTRIGAQVISGIGFLGVGTILTKGFFQITGLTTAAGLWATAAIGLAVGIGFYWGAVLGSVMVILIMTLVNRLVKTKNRSGPLERFYIEVYNEGYLRSLLPRIPACSAETDIVPAKTGLAGHIGVYISIPYQDSDAATAELEKLQQERKIVFYMPNI